MNTPNPSPQPNYPSSSPSNRVSLDLIGQAWQLVISNPGVWIAATVVYLFIHVIAYAILTLIAEENFNLQLLFNLFVSIIDGFVYAGMVTIALKQIRTGQAEFKSLFSVTNVFFSLSMYAIFYCLCSELLSFLIPEDLFFLSLIPTLLSGCLLFLVPALIADKKLSAFEAVKRSIEISAPQFLPLVLLAVTLFMALGLGLLACGVGVLLAFPVLIVTEALLYLQLVEGLQTNSNQMAPPPPPSVPPIANPSR